MKENNNSKIMRTVYNSLLYEEGNNYINILEVFRQEVIEEFSKYEHAFGNGDFYQSFTEMGIRGTRDTQVRMDIYSIQEFLLPDSKVLDIGSNIGFLDMEISKYVKSILGLEYSKELADIANRIANQMDFDNVHFVNCDYNEWQKNNKSKFDGVFSFAVHAWLDVKPDIYANQVFAMLNNEGILYFESQQLSTDRLFDVFVEAFINKGMQSLKELVFIDDGKTRRKLVIMKKVRDNKENKRWCLLR